MNPQRYADEIARWLCVVVALATTAECVADYSLAICNGEGPRAAAWAALFLHDCLPPEWLVWPHRMAYANDRVPMPAPEEMVA